MNNKSTVTYSTNPSYPPLYYGRRKRSGCSCDGNYAKSLQGICKIISIIVSLLTFIIVGASPYYRQIFVLEGVTWPFHIVMLLSVGVFLATLAMYIFFLSGQQLQYGHIAWPTVELYFNIVMFILSLFAALLEVTNVWRWDMSQGFSSTQALGGYGGVGGYGAVSGYGYRPGMSLSGSLNFNSYCTRYPNDCTDYFSLLAGNNSYFGNHIFATILLFILLISFAVSTFFSFRTWRVFKRDMTNGKNKPLKPSKWQIFRYRMSELKMPKVDGDGLKDRFNKLIGRDGDSVEGAGVDTESESISKRDTVPYDKAESDKRSTHASSIYSDSHKSHRSHHGTSSGSHHGTSSGSHQDGRRSRSSSNSRSNKKSNHDKQSNHHESTNDDGRRSEKSHRSHRSSHRHDDDREEKSLKSTPVVLDMKNVSNTTPDSNENGVSPVASFMI